VQFSRLNPALSMLFLIAVLLSIIVLFTLISNPYRLVRTAALSSETGTSLPTPEPTAPLPVETPSTPGVGTATAEPTIAAPTETQVPIPTHTLFPTPEPLRTVLGTIYPDATGTPPTREPRGTPDPTRVARQAIYAYLMNAYFYQPGTVIAEGSITPSPYSTPGYIRHEQLSYRVERVVLTQTVTFSVFVPTTTKKDVQLEQRTFDRFWRIIITGGTFRINSASRMIWLDDKIVSGGSVVEEGLMGIVHDPSLLQEGARIGISSDVGPGPPAYLIETLHLDTSP
jgi:hypothetical protein